MGKLKFKDFADSQHAIKEYMEYKPNNSYLHEARVIISSKGNAIFNDIIRVVVSIETNYSFVELVDSEGLEHDFYVRYTNEYQKFKFINGTLVIKAVDRDGNNIEIDITGCEKMSEK